MHLPLKNAIAVGALVLLGSISGAQVVREKPQELEKIDVDEQLGQQIPFDLSFTDDTGEPVTLGKYFRGEKPVALVMAYYTCPMLCNLVLNGMVAGIRDLPWTPGEQFEVVTVSIEETETHELAAAKKANYLKDLGKPQAAGGWHFLTGDASQSKALADAIGFRYYWDETQKQWAHPAVLILVSPEGKITRYLYGIEFKERDLRLGIMEASEGKIGNTIDRIILYCFHYDPEAGSYVMFARNVMALGGGVTVIVLGSLIGLLWWRDRRRRGHLASEGGPAGN